MLDGDDVTYESASFVESLIITCAAGIGQSVIVVIVQLTAGRESHPHDLVRRGDAAGVVTRVGVLFFSAAVLEPLRVLRQSAGLEL